MMPLQFVSDLVTHWFTSSCYNFQYQKKNGSDPEKVSGNT